MTPRFGIRGVLAVLLLSACGGGGGGGDGGPDTTPAEPIAAVDLVPAGGATQKGWLLRTGPDAALLVGLEASSSSYVFRETRTADRGQTWSAGPVDGWFTDVATMHHTYHGFEIRRAVDGNVLLAARDPANQEPVAVYAAAAETWSVLPEIHSCHPELHWTWDLAFNPAAGRTYSACVDWRHVLVYRDHVETHTPMQALGIDVLPDDARVAVDPGAGPQGTVYFAVAGRFFWQDVELWAFEELGDGELPDPYFQRVAAIDPGCGAGCYARQIHAYTIVDGVHHLFVQVQRHGGGTMPYLIQHLHGTPEAGFEVETLGVIEDPDRYLAQESYLDVQPPLPADGPDRKLYLVLGDSSCVRVLGTRLPDVAWEQVGTVRLQYTPTESNLVVWDDETIACAEDVTGLRYVAYALNDADVCDAPRELERHDLDPGLAVNRLSLVYEAYNLRAEVEHLDAESPKAICNVWHDDAGEVDGCGGGDPNGCAGFATGSGYQADVGVHVDCAAGGMWVYLDTMDRETVELGMLALLPPPEPTCLGPTGCQLDPGADLELVWEPGNGYTTIQATVFPTGDPDTVLWEAEVPDDGALTIPRAELTGAPVSSSVELLRSLVVEPWFELAAGSEIRTQVRAAATLQLYE